jgi:predicted component of type VI protein secretion system
MNAFVASMRALVDFHRQTLADAAIDAARKYSAERAAIAHAEDAANKLAAALAALSS